MPVKNDIHAKEIAKDFLIHDNVVVTESGDIYAACNLEEVCSELEKEEKKFFIVKGERNPVQKDAE